MKKLIITAAIAFSAVAFNSAAEAQIRASVNINIGSQPDWGPVGYDQANYYYMPDIDTYYDVPSHQYVYLQNNRWIHAGNLPSRYSNYDVYNGYKVVVNQASPWNRADYYRSHYANYRGRHDQALIRDSRDEHYKNHWRGNNNDQYGNGNGNDGRLNNGRGNGNNGRYNNGHGNGNNGRGNGNRNHGRDNNRGHGHD